MKAYFLLAVGVIWFAVAIFVCRTGLVFGVYWSRPIDPAAVAVIFHVGFSIIFFGWIVPVGLGLRLLRAKG